MHLVGFIIRIFYDARSSECRILQCLSSSTCRPSVTEGLRFCEKLGTDYPLTQSLLPKEQNCQLHRCGNLNTFVFIADVSENIDQYDYIMLRYYGRYFNTLQRTGDADLRFKHG